VKDSHEIVSSIADTCVYGWRKRKRGTGSKRYNWTVVNESVDVQGASLQTASFIDYVQGSCSNVEFLGRPKGTGGGTIRNVSKHLEVSR